MIPLSFVCQQAKPSPAESVPRAAASVISTASGSERDQYRERQRAWSVPRAVASVAPEVGYWLESRSPPLAVLIRRAL